LGNFNKNLCEIACKTNNKKNDDLYKMCSEPTADKLSFVTHCKYEFKFDKR